MATWTGTARSNYFIVRDLDAFKAEFAKYEVEILEGTGPNKGKVALASDAEYGGWPTNVMDDAGEDYIDIDIAYLVAQHLVDGEVAVFQECGAHKFRYLTGVSRAINNKFEEVVINIDDIYAQAAHLGANITEATY